MKLLPEAGESPNKVGLLKKSLYGTRDAPSNWEHAIKVVFEACGFTQGLSNPCIYFHEERQLYANVHGDDFTVVGDFHQLQWLVNTLKASWTLDVRGILARPGSGLPASEVIHSISVLNRLVTWTEKGIEMEADPRHVQLVLQQLNLEAATPVATPLVKTKPGEENDTPLSTSEAATYRSTAMRLGYLSLDRPDLLRTVRELAKGLEEPTMHHWSTLKRAARYLRGCARLVQLIPHQNSFTTVLGWSDSNHAGCVRSRKSTTGTVIQLGQSVIKAQAKGQAVIALSTGRGRILRVDQHSVSCIRRTGNASGLADSVSCRYCSRCQRWHLNRLPPWPGARETHRNVFLMGAGPCRQAAASTKKGGNSRDASRCNDQAIGTTHGIAQSNGVPQERW